MSSLLERLPGKCVVLYRVLGVDANVELNGGGFLEPHTGPLATGSIWDERATLFVEFLQSWGMVATNTFAGKKSTVLSSIFIPVSY